MNYSFYITDLESTGLDCRIHDVLELSMYRLGDESDNAQKTWCLKPFTPETCEPVALKINGHKFEDITHQTKEGRERYLDPNKVIIEIENWLTLDELPAEKRFLVGQNISFDKNFLEQLWIKCNSKDSFPFGRRMIDTMILELFFDYCGGEFAEGYSLKNLIKKYGVTNTKAHTAAADVVATKQVFEKQVDYFKKLLNK
jgi:DNA polymerase III alpha subunit (gram-positive type)